MQRLHGDDAARRAEAAFVTQFVKKEVPDEIPEHSVTGPTDIVSLLVATGIAATGNDARRLVEQGGVRVNGNKVGSDAAPRPGDVISARRRFSRLK